MKITEKDIYNFVNYKVELAVDKLKFIEQNLSKYQEQIDLIRDIEESKKRSLSENAIVKFNEEVRQQNSANIYILSKVNESYTRTDEVLNLAADSFELKKHNIADTFIDEKNKLLLKVINSEEESKIFLFNEENEEIKNFDIIIKKPVEQTYHCETNREPLIVERFEDVESVEVRLN